MNQKNIIIADDHAVVRTGMQLILEDTFDLTIAGEAKNGNELLEQMRNHQYDLVILDLSMPVDLFIGPQSILYSNILLCLGHDFHKIV